MIFQKRKVITLIILRFGEILAPYIHRDWPYLMLNRETQLNMFSLNKKIKAQREGWLKGLWKAALGVFLWDIRLNSVLKGNKLRVEEGTSIALCQGCKR